MQTAIINFQGNPLITLEKEGERYVAMKPIAEALGLRWGSQYNRIKRDEVLNTSIFMMTIQVSGDTQHREMVFLPISMLNGWLFGIDTKRVKTEIRPLITQYKRDCYKVLDEHWDKKEESGKSLLERMREILVLDEKSKTKGSIGSSLMSQRKKELHVLKEQVQRLEEEIQLSLPALGESK